MYNKEIMAWLAIWPSLQQYLYLIEANVGRYGGADIALEAR